MRQRPQKSKHPSSSVPAPYLRFKESRLQNVSVFQCGTLPQNNARVCPPGAVTYSITQKGQKVYTKFSTQDFRKSKAPCRQKQQGARTLIKIARITPFAPVQRSPQFHSAIPALNPLSNEDTHIHHCPEQYRSHRKPQKRT